MPLTTYTAGEVLTAASLNANFSAAGGLQFVKAQTIGSGVSAVTVTGAFSATYDNYLVIVSGGVASADTSLVLTLGSTTTGYYWVGSSQQYGSSTLNSTFVNNGASFSSVVYASTNALSGQCVIDNPFSAKRTMVRYEATGSSTTYFRNQAQGFLDNATSYTAFTLTTTSGTVTGGTIRVYGYQNS